MYKYDFDEISRQLSEIENLENKNFLTHALGGVELDRSLIVSKKKTIVTKELVDQCSIEAKKERKHFLLYGRMLNEFIGIDDQICKLADELEMLSDENRELITQFNTTKSDDEIRVTNQRNAELSARMKTKVTELVELRNERARGWGFNNFADLGYTFLEVSTDAMTDYSEELFRKSDSQHEDYLSRLRHYTGKNNTWTGIAVLGDILEKRISSIDPRKSLLKLVDDWGMSHVLDRISFVNPKTGNDFTRFIPLDPPEKSVVIVDALSPCRDVSSLFHEFGHALHFTLIKDDFKAYDHEPLMMEIPSVFFNYIAFGDDWVVQNFCDCSTELKEMFDLVNIANNPDMIAGQCFQTLFEIELYRQSATDPDQIHRELFRRLFGKETEEGARLDVYDFSWPFYNQSYLLGFGYSKFFYQSFIDRLGTIYALEVGSMFAKTLLESGNAVCFKDRIKKLAESLKTYDMPDFLKDLIDC